MEYNIKLGIHPQVVVWGLGMGCLIKGVWQCEKVLGKFGIWIVYLGKAREEEEVLIMGRRKMNGGG